MREGIDAREEEGKRKKCSIGTLRVEEEETEDNWRVGWSDFLRKSLDPFQIVDGPQFQNITL